MYKRQIDFPNFQSFNLNIILLKKNHLPKYINPGYADIWDSVSFLKKKQSMNKLCVYDSNIDAEVPSSSVQQ